MHHHESEELIKRIILGEAAAENQLFDLFTDQVGYLVRRKIGWDNPDWEDVHQEIFVAVFARIRSRQFDPAKGCLAGFMQSTIKYKVLDYYKNPWSKKNHEVIEQHQNTLLDSDPDPEAAVMQEQKKCLIQSAVGSLAPKYKTVLYWAVYKQLRIQEVARLLGCSEQKVSNLKSYAITLLKRKLKMFEDFDENV